MLDLAIGVPEADRLAVLDRAGGASTIARRGAETRQQWLRSRRLLPPLHAERSNAPIPSITADPAFAWSSVRNVLLFGWLAGFAFRFAVTVRQWGRLRRVRQTSEVVLDSAITDIRRQEAARLRIRRMPELREMQSDEGPLLAGVWRPTIVIPRSAPRHV